jgi:hypothetical protein
MPQVVEVWPLKSSSKNSGVHRNSNSQWTPWGCEGSFLHTFSHSWEYVVWLLASFLARNLANSCLGCEPKVRVTTLYFFYSILVAYFSKLFQNRSMLNNIFTQFLSPSSLFNVMEILLSKVWYHASPCQNAQ